MILKYYQTNSRTEVSTKKLNMLSLYEKSFKSNNILQKSGKWCAMHVKIAWEIHQHQQKQSDASKGAEGKSSDHFHPPGHMVGGSSLHRPGEISSTASYLGKCAFSCIYFGL